MAARAADRRSLGALVASSGVWALLSAPVAGQIDAGLLARVRDHEIAVNYDASADRTEVRLSIAPSGTGGNVSAVTLVFVGQFAGRTAAAWATTLAITGRALGSEFSFAAEQRDALREFARRVVP